MHVPAFQTLWGFTIASDAPLQQPESELDDVIARRVSKPLRHYDGETHRGMFALPKFLREGIERENRINRDDHPRIYGLASREVPLPLSLSPTIVNT